eukprot:gnl/MRDRNA2_/MRDRNA2_69327_c0_seq1.p1 gnl/MRDRNA2_/MRDRNA2_69327_c0~~gnl/MRDRNA2_/MRDRNA2_69327_c0_seq1.p1  ORF type:complete len:716 (+),score=108.82 gnl/MRDRNA2_/MRDRNA2_69327_c0_seq1:77-2224(+)
MAAEAQPHLRLLKQKRIVRKVATGSSTTADTCAKSELRRLPSSPTSGYAAAPQSGYPPVANSDHLSSQPSHLGQASSSSHRDSQSSYNLGRPPSSSSGLTSSGSQPANLGRPSSSQRNQISRAPQLQVLKHNGASELPPRPGSSTAKSRPSSTGSRSSPTNSGLTNGYQGQIAQRSGSVGRASPASSSQGHMPVRSGSVGPRKVRNATSSTAEISQLPADEPQSGTCRSSSTPMRSPSRSEKHPGAAGTESRGKSSTAGAKLQKRESEEGSTASGVLHQQEGAAVQVAVLLRGVSEDLPCCCRQISSSSVEFKRMGANVPPRKFDFNGGINCCSELHSALGSMAAKAGAAVRRSIANAERFCIWAFGPRGVGKSSLMWGIGNEGDGLAGVVSSEVFRSLRELGCTLPVPENDPTLLVTVQCIKVGTTTELAGDCLGPSADLDGKLNIHENPLGGFALRGLPEREVRSAEDLVNQFRMSRERLGEPGSYMSGKKRASDPRSHGLLTIRVRRRDAKGVERCAEIHLLDLAGAERSGIGRAGTDGVPKKKPGEKSIEDKTLKAIHRVVDALAESPEYVFRDGHSAPRHIPYRDSKVTRLLMECLGGPGCCLALVCLDATSHDEALAALEFAVRIGSMRNEPVPMIIDREAILQGIDSDAAKLAEPLGLLSKLQKEMEATDIQLDMDSPEELVQLRDLLEKRRRILLSNVWDNVRAAKQ